MAKELLYTQLKNFGSKDFVNFETTKQLEPFNGIIGQNRGERALEFGLAIKFKGYNLYVSGDPGTGKATFAKEFAKKIAKSEKCPPDMCYVYNFKDPKCPMLFKLPAGTGKVFAEDMDELVDSILEELPKVLSDKEFENQKGDVLKGFQEIRDSKIKEMTEDARTLNFGVKSTNSGIYFMPIHEGEAITEEQYDELEQDVKDEINKHSDAVSERAAEIMRDIKDHEKLVHQQIEEMEYSVSLFTVGRYIGDLLEKYADNQQIINYLLDVKEDILSNTEDFTSADQEEEDALSVMLPWYSKKTLDSTLTKYKVNVLTDNKDLDGAPVIVEYNPVYANLVGDIEYDNEYGNFTTDFMKIKAGALHKANGGYLILQAADLFSSLYAWECLRRVLRTGKITIEPLREYSSGITVAGIKPESAEVDVKVILVGTNYYYDLIYEYDDDFHKIFKIRADFDYEMGYNSENVKSMLGFIKKFIESENCLEFDAAAIVKILEFSSRAAERQDKLTAQFSKVTDILAEASAWAIMDSKELVTVDYVMKAIYEREYRLNMYEEKMGSMIEEKAIMIETTGSKIGQINGLAVIDLGDYVFAKPTRITATTYVGRAGIVNIEKEAEMSGSIHDKGVQVITGYLGSVYAQEFPLSLSCRICFEQNYSGIDGDSASSTELYAILSSLSDLPINQELAVTGSVNQHGEIQPIGGVSYKIEGFFDVCKKRGLTGKQGVIMPAQNIVELVLKNEVIEAVKEGKFHIYPITHVNEGIEILTGAKIGEKNEKGNYPVNSISGRVLRKLKKFHKKAVADA